MAPLGRIRLASTSSDSPLRLRRLSSTLLASRSLKDVRSNSKRLILTSIRIGTNLPLRVRPIFILLTAFSLFVLGALGFHPTLAKKISPDVPFSDKILHFVCFAFASAEFYAIWIVDETARALHWRYLAEWLSVLVCGLIGSIGSEFVQGLLPYKTFQWGDVVVRLSPINAYHDTNISQIQANIFGTALGISLARAWTRAHRRALELRRLYRPVDLAAVDELDSEAEEDDEDREMEEGRTPPLENGAARMFDDQGAGVPGSRKMMAKIEANVWDESDEIFGLGDEEEDEAEGRNR
ncbi:hypothetical protein P7C70_g6006, partial [Phenoliferia sp. Uapishka_3]